MTFDLPDWHLDAACLDHPYPEWWFPEPSDVQTSPAFALCATCPVKAECLHHAMTYPELYGIWGGTTERDRTRNRAAAP